MLKGVLTFSSQVPHVGLYSGDTLPTLETTKLIKPPDHWGTALQQALVQVQGGSVPYLMCG